MPGIQTRRWCFTLQTETLTPANVLDEWIATGNIVYGIAQLEKGLESGRRHIQGYVITSAAKAGKGRTLTWVKKELNTKAHWEPCKGTHEQNQQYCSKDETRIPHTNPHEVGEWNEELAGPQGVGERHKKKLNDLVVAIEGGASNADLLRSEDYREMAFRFGQHIDRTRNALQPLTREWQTRLLILAGPSGTGKSHKAHEIAKKYRDEDVYYATKPGPDGKFWMDGYHGQPVVVFDEFDGSWCQHRYFLRLIDRYPFMVETKGSSTPWLAKFVIITSNLRWEAWWKVDDIEPLRRRCTGEIGHMNIMMDKYERPADAQVESAENWIAREIAAPSVGRIIDLEQAEIPPVGTMTHRANIVDLTEEDEQAARELAYSPVHRDNGYEVEEPNYGVYDSQDEWDDEPDRIAKFMMDGNVNPPHRVTRTGTQIDDEPIRLSKDGRYENDDDVDDKDPAERGLDADARRSATTSATKTPLPDVMKPFAPPAQKLSYQLPVEKPGVMHICPHKLPNAQTHVIICAICGIYNR